MIPEAGRKEVMRILHDGHPGASRMKALARGMVWWPRMDADLESVVQQCQPCQANRKAPPVAPLHPWEWPTKPWSRLHVNFARHFQGKTFIGGCPFKMARSCYHTLHLFQTSHPIHETHICHARATGNVKCQTMAVPSRVRNSKHSPPEMESGT